MRSFGSSSLIDNPQMSIAMTRSTSPVAIAALCLGLLAPATATFGQTAPADEPLRICRGNIVTLAWGTVVRDKDGACRRAETARRTAPPRVPTPSAMQACTNTRSYLGGVLQICDDQPRARGL